MQHAAAHFKTSILTPYLPIIMVMIGAFFYTYEIFIRVLPSMITSELMQTFALTASKLGFISSLFYYAYTAMQIPAGLLCDRFGPKRLLFSGLFICGSATILLGTATTTVCVGLMRFISGAVSSFAMICPLVLIHNWLPSQYFALFTGMIQALGCLGAILGGKPLAILLHLYGWRSTLYLVGGIGILLAIFLLCILRDRPQKSNSHNSKAALNQSMWTSLTLILTHKQNWFIGLTGFFSWGPLAAFAELWGVESISQLYQTSSEAATMHILWIWIGVGTMSPLIGWWSDSIKSRKIPLITCFSLSCISTLILNLSLDLHPYMLNLILFFLGLSAASQVITFSLIKEQNPSSITGTAVSFNNMAVIFGGVVLQPLFGWILDYFWLGAETAVHTRIYSAVEYHDAMWIMPICSLLGLFMSTLLIQETHCQKQA